MIYRPDYISRLDDLSFDMYQVRPNIPCSKMNTDWLVNISLSSAPRIIEILGKQKSLVLDGIVMFLACENIRFSSVFAAGGRFARKVPSGEERGETDVFAGYHF